MVTQIDSLLRAKIGMALRNIISRHTYFEKKWNPVLVLPVSSAQPILSVRRLGLVAQLVERLNGIQEVRGSIPLGSTVWQR